MNGLRWTTLAVALVTASAARAADPVPAAIHPLEANGASEEEVQDVESMLAAAVLRYARRGAFQPAAAIPRERRCAGAGSAARPCLAKLARNGVVLHGSVKPSGRYVVALLYATDGTGRTVGPVGAALDPMLQNPEVLVTALERLEAQLQAPRQQPLAARPPAAASGDAPQPSPPKSADLRPAPPSAPAPPLAGLTYREEPEPKADWRGTAGKWLVASGAALLAGGATVAWLDRRLSSQLDQKYKTNSLTPADASSYDRVKTYNTVGTSLLLAGSAAALGGAVLWGIAASDEPSPRGPWLSIAGAF